MGPVIKESQQDSFNPIQKGNLDIPLEETKAFSEENKELKFLIFNKDNLYLSLGLQAGYINGETYYDFDHQTSELDFPLDNGMFGGSLSLGLKDLFLLNFEIWAPFYERAGSDMEDKDWDDRTGNIVSFTKSKADLNAIIYDINLQYDFFKKGIFGDTGLLDKSDKIKIGLLLGYRHERFDYDMYDIYYPDYYLRIYEGVKVLTYTVKYKLPYVGLASSIENENYGIDFNIKYSFYPTAEDVDTHLLRGLVFYGDYDKNGQVFMGDVNMYWKFKRNWKFLVGTDAAFINIAGTTWEAKHEPVWDKDQYVNAVHWIFWTGVEYIF